ncbi:MAG TPA: isoprenylcysteine carboxylmethyltransferase family protein [Spirochaetia bacterium]|nr:isoprenylcysteine carboxylmethyltransferase family protein [Spirochaetia bacterium]
MIYDYIMGACWLAFIVFWVVASIGIKKDASRHGSAWFLVGIRLLIAVAIVVVLRVPYLRSVVVTGIHRFAVNHPAIQAAGAALCVIGLALALWARTSLGTNWSGSPAAKEGHELVTSGPYGVIRHPIYTGMLTMMLGTALIAGAPGLLVLVAFSAIVAYRVRVEERLMQQLFPGTYREYRGRTRALIPFVL